MSLPSDPFVPEPGDDKLTCAMVSDSLDELGLRAQVLSPDILALFAGARIFGRASTAQFVPTQGDSDGPYDDAIAYIDSLGAGEVAVLATGSNLSTAYWGELFSAAAIGRQVAGVLTDGAVRDVARVEALGFPVFCAARRPIDFRARMKIDRVRETVQISGVNIEGGDLILGDADGVVVIPREIEDQVLIRARIRATKESAVLSHLLSGESLRVVWDTYSVL